MRGKLNTVFLRNLKDELVLGEGLDVPDRFYETTVRIPFTVWKCIEAQVTECMKSQDTQANSRFKVDTALWEASLLNELVEVKKTQIAEATRLKKPVPEFKSPYPGTALKPVKTVVFS